MIKWAGPFRVTECQSEFLFRIQDLRTDEQSVCHGARLKFFRNKDFDKVEELSEHLAYLEGELCILDEFTGIRSHQGEIQLLPQWRGFEAEETVWESLDTMFADVPDMTRDFLQDLENKGTPKERELARKAISCIS